MSDTVIDCQAPRGQTPLLLQVDEFMPMAKPSKDGKTTSAKTKKRAATKASAGTASAKKTAADVAKAKRCPSDKSHSIESGDQAVPRPGRRSSQRRQPAGNQRTQKGGAPTAGHERGESALRQAQFCLAQTDAVDWLRSFESESVDLVITDPPYESLEKHRAIGTTTRLKHSKASSNDWFKIFPNARFPELFHEIFRVLKKDRHFYLFTDAETMFAAKPIAEAQGFKFWKPLVWDKQRIGMGYHYRSRYEFVLFFEKGKRKLNDLGQPDIIPCPRVFRGYPTEKPTGVSDVLVRQSTQEGELVIDPFMGSASVGVASLEAKRRFLGNDLSDSSHELANKRLLAHGEQQESLAQSVLESQSTLL